MRQISTSTLTNQNIATALLAFTYTADADRELSVRLFADQVAGAGNYVAYMTIQRAGAGSAYEIQPRSFSFVASGVTAISFLSAAIPILNTDVLKIYILGLASDTTTPDITTEIWESDYLRPITAGQFATSIDASGRVDVIKIAGTTQTALDLAANYTAARAAKIDNLDAAITTRTKPADTQAAVTLVATVTTYTGNTPQTGDAYARLGAAGAGLTALGDARLANLDAAISTIPTANTNADALLDRANAIETGWTLRQIVRVISAGIVGKLSGAATATITIRNAIDTKDRVTATVDANGNRTAVTLDGT